MKFLEACKGQDRSVVDWMVAHGIFPTVVKCPACNYDKLSCVLAGGTPRWQCRAEGCRKKVKSSYNVPGNWCLFLFFIVDTVCERKAIPRAHQDTVGVSYVSTGRNAQHWAEPRHQHTAFPLGLRLRGHADNSKNRAAADPHTRRPNNNPQDAQPTCYTHNHKNNNN
jgi:hypothetical protein